MNATRIKHVPIIGDYVVPDTWGLGDKLAKSDWERADFTLRGPNTGRNIAVCIEVTGKRHHSNWNANSPTLKSRCRIEFVGDCEPSGYVRGWIYHE